MVIVRRALLSVSDKTGLVPFAQGLVRLGVQLLSTGGTAKLLRAHRVPVRDVSEFTGFPELLEGRVKTLHPKVHGAILAKRDHPTHVAQARQHGFEFIDLVVVNLYPFEATVRGGGATLEEAIEQIDIGGPAMLRSAAKNFRAVGVVCRPARYPEILEALAKAKGRLPDEQLYDLAVEAFAHTAWYDSAIYAYLDGRRPAGATPPLPDQLVLQAVKRQDLRYGENPHQRAAFYQTLPPLGTPPAASALTPTGLAAMTQLHGKALSFNNLLDVSAASALAHEFPQPCVAIIKHTNPCGVACAPTLRLAFQRAYACDPLSAFGSIIGFNRIVDVPTARALVASEFLECLAAPGYQAAALKLLQQKKNLRILKLPPPAPHQGPSAGARGLDVKTIAGGCLVQDLDRLGADPAAWKAVTRRAPTAAQRRSLTFAWLVAKHVKSNAIVVVRSLQTVGIGVGQTSRVDSAATALKKAGRRARGAVLASDGFFPKPDGVQVAARAGIAAIVQPGGSIRDAQVIAAADRAKLAMVVTGQRHFRH
ncbi:MAG: bifunctional phosphoribosylaminoimidazolecarboxamide formyltransferase/IMP cyclohydrolase [Omnitrophica WOR_2 bacterium RIFCSPHIGHO2_02_FULL_68_15]|nr:MAG: bifunctional phosphoribosylaminoimidazolecarboxamide formyltransferase/IMP cyclohydrolase [Omnitrophica WOR_2 bacterium RIFCSPHIGHO2_02_FULL_68_15]